MSAIPRMPRRPVVLIVEDHPLVQITAAALIEDAGMDTVVAADADEALGVLTARDDIHAVFTDVEMPGSMNGVALAHRVREHWPAIQVIVTSGGKLPADTILPGDVSFLQKPYEFANVVDELRSPEA